MSELIKKYGEYIIQPGTLLYRVAANTGCYPTMFLGFCSFGASTANFASDTIQVWRTTKEIRSLLMLKGRRLTGEDMLLFSAIVDIYNSYFTDNKKDEYDDLMLKKEDTSDRRKIINELLKQGITSWVCSVEDKHQMELFLFQGAAQHEECISCIGTYETSWRNNLRANNSFNYETLQHLPEMRKGPPPSDPFWEQMISR